MDDNTDSLPSGYDARPIQPGETDYGTPEFPGSMWLAMFHMQYLDGTQGVAYRLLWGDGTTEEPEIDGELWLRRDQMRELSESYQRCRVQEMPLTDDERNGNA